MLHYLSVNCTNGIKVILSILYLRCWDHGPALMPRQIEAFNSLFEMLVGNMSDAAVPATVAFQFSI